MSSKASKHALLGPSIANFSVQYNFQVIAIALAIAQRDMPQETWVKTQDKSVIFIGCILGQFLMGYAGDLVGRTKALSLTLSLAVLGAVGSSLGPWGDVTDVYTTIIAFRFVIGNYLPKTRKTFFLGIRTPWTLTSDYAWEKTHRLAGPLYMAAGALGILYAFSLDGIWLVIAFVGTVMSVTLFSAAYSWFAWRKAGDRNEGADYVV